MCNSINVYAFNNIVSLSPAPETKNREERKNLQKNPCSLHEAVRNLHLQAMEGLLECTNVDPNRMDEQGKTPLARAVEMGSCEAVAMLLKCPATDPNLCDPLISLLESLGTADSSTTNHDKIQIAKMLADDPRTNPLKISLKGQSALSTALSQNNELFSSVNIIKVPLHKPQTTKRDINNVPIYSSWVYVSFLPVSDDPQHQPPETFTKNVKVIDPSHFENTAHGKIEIIQKDGADTYKRVVYTTHDFMTSTLLKNMHPMGPTIYRPLLSISKTPEPSTFSGQTVDQLKKMMKNCGNFWHISDPSDNQRAQYLRESIVMLAENNICFFRALNADHDLPLLLSGEPLKGRGNGGSIKTQVQKGGTKLVSVSTKPITKFLGKSKVQNGGFISIYSDEVGHLFLESTHSAPSYPAYADHAAVIDELDNNLNLINRARDAHEAMFRSPIPPSLITYFEGGCPKESAKCNKKPDIQPSSKLIEILEKYDIEYDTLEEKDKNNLLSMLNAKGKMRDFVEKIAANRVRTAEHEGYKGDI